MSAPVRIEAEAFGDPRFEVLGHLLGTSKYDALGRMSFLWSWCTERERYDVPEWIAAIYFQHDTDKVALVVAAELAEWIDCTEPAAHQQDCQHLRLRGTNGRTEWLGEKRASKVEGGKARAKGAKRGPNGTFESSSHQHAGCDHPAELQQNVQQTTSSQPAQSSALTLALTPTLVLEEKNSATPPARGSRSRGQGKKAEFTAAETETAMRLLAKLGSYNNVTYSGTDEHKRLIVNQLRAGRTEDDLRMVIGYCCFELDWLNKPDMRKYLRPETLFGPKTISKYLDPARSWFPTLEQDESPSDPGSPSEDRIANARTFTGPEWVEPSWMAAGGDA